MDNPDIIEFVEKYCSIKKELPPGEKFVASTHHLQLYFYSLLNEGEGNETCKPGRFLQDANVYHIRRMFLWAKYIWRNCIA